MFEHDNRKLLERKWPAETETKDPIEMEREGPENSSLHPTYILTGQYCRVEHRDS